MSVLKSVSSWALKFYPLACAIIDHHFFFYKQEEAFTLTLHTSSPELGLLLLRLFSTTENKTAGFMK